MFKKLLILVLFTGFIFALPPKGTSLPVAPPEPPPQKLPWEPDVCLTPNMTTYNYAYSYLSNWATHTPNNRVYGVWYRTTTGYPVIMRWWDQSGSWSPEETVTKWTPSFTYNYYPSVAGDSNNNVHFIWRGYLSTPTGYWLYYRAKLANGNYTNPCSLPTKTTTVYYPKIAGGKGDTAHTAFYVYWGGYYTVGYAKIYPSYPTPTVVDIDTVAPWGWTSQYYPHIAVDGQNRVHVVWYGYITIGSSYYNIFYRMRDANGVWGQVETVSVFTYSYYNYYPRVAVDGNGNVHVVWMAYTSNDYYYHIAHRMKTSSGWGPVTIYPPSTSYYWYYPTCAVDPSNNLHITFYTNAWGSYYNIGRLIRYANGTWSDLDTVTYFTDSYYRYYPEIVATRDGNIHIFRMDYAPYTNYYYWIYYKRFRELNYDVGVKSILAPNGPIERTSLIPQVVVKNYGRNAATNFQVRMYIDPGNYYDYRTISSLGAGAETTISFNSWTPNESVWFRVKCTTAFTSDENPNNDKKTAMAAVYDYYQPFEASNGGFTATGDWKYGQYGLPGDTYAWSTAGYANYSNSKLITCRYLALVDTPVVAYWHQYQIESYFDGYNVKCSIPGQSWQIIHAIPGLGQGYNYVAYSGNAGIPSESCYSYNQGWMLNWMKIPVSSGSFFWLNFHFGSDASVTYWGPTIDKVYGFGFTDRSPYDVGVKEIITPTGMQPQGTYSPQAIIKNYGLNNATNIDVTFKIGDFYSSTINIGTLLKDQETTLTFTSVNLTPGLYPVMCSTYFAPDQDPSNDKKSTYTGIYNYFENFEATNGNLIPDPATNAWEWGKPTAGPGSGQGSDTMVWATNLEGNYDYNANWKLTTPFFYATKDNPVIAYYHWYENEGGYDGYNVKYSTDGTNWYLAHAVPGYGQPYERVMPSANAGIPGESAYSGTTTLHKSWRLNFIQLPVTSGTPVAVRFHFGSDDIGEYYGTAIDKIYGIGLRLVHDVGTVEILSPTGEIPIGTTVPVRAKYKNFGSYTETFKAYFRIDYEGSPVYLDSAFLTLSPGQELTVAFSDYTVSNLGTHNTYAWTVLTGDEVPDNDQVTGTFDGVLYDVGPTAIITPTGVQLPGQTVAPQAVVENFGNRAGTFDVVFNIYQQPASLVYSDTLNITLAPGEVDTLTFDNYTTAPGLFTDEVYTLLANDMNRANDTLKATFTTGQVDFAVTRIVSPAGLVIRDTATPKPVKAKVKNNGNVSLGVDVCFAIWKEGLVDPVYTDTVSVPSINPGEEVEVNFEPYLCKDTGNYTTLAKTLMADMNPDNDSLVGSFRVTTRPPGWYRMADVMGATKPVKSGGALCALGDKIYALVGNNTRDLMVYDVNTNTWTKKSEVPLSGLTTKKKNVKKGASICTDGQYIYVAKGNNTQEFWRYKPEGDSWKEYQVGFSKGIKGSSMAWDGDSFIYIICGSSNNEWKRFNIYTETFEACNPASLPADKWKTGSWIVYVNGNIYALRVGGKTNEFYMIPIGGTASPKAEMPLIGSTGKKKKAKEGSAGAYNPDNGLIYALKGGNTLEFFSYNPETDQWTPLEDVGKPTGTPAKRVKGGGSLTYSSAAACLFAFVGNNTNEFWSYTPGGTFLASANPSGNNGIQVETKNLKNFTLTIIPTRDYLKVSYTLPVNIKATLKIYNALGEIVYNGTSDKGYFTIDTKKFSTGIYIMKFAANEYKATKKLVIH
ncbi:MAG: CARDB domain-containing protein [candidate division WOR-3 bacterium]